MFNIVKIIKANKTNNTITLINVIASKTSMINKPYYFESFCITIVLCLCYDKPFCGKNLNDKNHLKNALKNNLCKLTSNITRLY